MKTSKILSSSFYKSHGTGANLTQYHNVQLEGEPRQYNIGAKEVNPPFLQPGQTLEWEWKDEAKGSIKKYRAPYTPGQIQAPAAAPVSDPTELRISTGLICATLLYTGGKIDKDQVDEMAARIVRKFDDIKLSL